MSILDEAVPAAELSPKYNEYLVKALLAGESGSGKTTLACTLPHENYGKLLLLDFDGRSDSIAGEEHVEIVKIRPQKRGDQKVFERAQAAVDDIWEAVDKDKFPYDGLIADGLSSLNRFGIWWTFSLKVKGEPGKGPRPIETGPGGSPAQLHYNPQMFQLANLILSLIPIPRHFVLTAHLDRYEDAETGIVRYWPKMFGNTRTEIGAWFNETYECFRMGDKKNRRYFINTGRGGEMGFVKSALNKRSKYWKDPIEIDFEEPPVGFEKLIKMRFEEEGRTREQKKAISSMEESNRNSSSGKRASLSQEK